MSALICDICGGMLSMDASGEFAVCESCGTRHSKERVQAKAQEIKGTVEITKGNAELERLLKNAEIYISLDKLGDAEDLYQTISEEYPSDSSGWWGCFTTYMRSVSSSKTFDLMYSYPFIQAQTAIKISPELKNEYQRIINKLVQQIKCGEIIPVAFPYKSKDGFSIGISWMFEDLAADDSLRTYAQVALNNAAEYNQIICTLELFRSEDKNAKELEMIYPWKTSSTTQKKNDLLEEIFKESNIKITGNWFCDIGNSLADIIMGKTVIICAPTIGTGWLEFSWNSLALPTEWEKFKPQLISIVNQYQLKTNKNENENKKTSEELLENKTAKTSGCYIATAVYGSYDCPEVWTLRRFRDQTLVATWYGRMFIRLYYETSPTLVKLFGHTAWFKKIWKRKLDYMVKKLNSRGVKNTPYQDRNLK